MHQFTTLRDLLILVAVAIPVVALAHRLRVPTVVGFLLTGIAIGPHALGLIRESDSVSGLAEIGVVLLLFAIGLELSLSRIVRLGRTVIQGGALQMALTIGAVTLIAMAFGVPAGRAGFYGGLAAMSSTAIMLKVYHERGEIDTPPGRVAVAISLFQDLSIVPLMVLMPLLSGADPGQRVPLRDIAESLAVVAALVLGGRLVVPRVLERLAALRNREIFTLAIVFLGLSAAYVTASFGLSLAIGAFIAGLVVAESEYGMQALSDVLPFRDTFSGIFFTSVGMLLDPSFAFTHPVLVFGAAAAVLALKTAASTAAVLSLKRSLQVSLMSGLALAPVGEFSFVLAGVGAPLGLIGPNAYQVFLGASVLTMLAAPFLIAGGHRIADSVSRRLGRSAVDLSPREESELARLTDHVVIVGYGLNGRNLARVLKAAGIAYVVLEQNGPMVRRARLEREPVLFGDGTRHDVLAKVGLERARAIVFAISAPAEERRGVAMARQLSRSVQIIVRTRYVREIEELERLGADQVVPEEFETSLEIFSRVLRLYGVPGNAIEREVALVRGEHYEALRGLDLPPIRPDALRHLGVHAVIETVEVEPGARAVGGSPVSLGLRRHTGATVIAAVRQGQPYHVPDPHFRFQPGDIVVLVGDRAAIDKGTSMFRASVTP